MTGFSTFDLAGQTCSFFKLTLTLGSVQRKVEPLSQLLRHRVWLLLAQACGIHRPQRRAMLSGSGSGILASAEKILPLLQEILVQPESGEWKP